MASTTEHRNASRSCNMLEAGLIYAAAMNCDHEYRLEQ